MEVCFPTTMSEFRGEVESKLDQEPAKHQLMLSNMVRLGDAATQDDVVMAVVRDDAAPVLAALWLKPYRLLLAGIGDDTSPMRAAAALADSSGTLDFPGVLAEERLASAFCAAYTASHGIPFGKAKGMHIHELRRVNPPRPVPGTLRTAKKDELELTTRWALAFGEETGTPGWSEEYVRARIDAGQAYLWDDAGPRCLAFEMRPLRQGLSIGGVYTPPEARRRGYASACVAALSQDILDRGFSYASLFTDAANATTNHIYHEIGYRRLASIVQIDRDPADT